MYRIISIESIGLGTILLVAPRNTNRTRLIRAKLTARLARLPAMTRI